MITDISKYPPFSFHTKPYQHQEEDFERSKDSEFFAFFWEMGTGKSKPILDTAIYQFLRKEIDGLVLIADKGCYLNWLYDQIPVHVNSQWPIRKAFWSSSMDRRSTHLCDRLLTAQDDLLDILCINVESLAFERSYEFLEQFIKSHWTMMVVDESTSIKNHKAERSKAAIALGKQCSIRRIATGTPITQSPLDLYGQCEFLKQGSLGFSSFVPFKCYYAMIQQVVQGTRRYEQILGYRNLQELTRTILPFSSRRLKSECLDLPPKIYETRYVEQTAEQRELYRKLKEEALVVFSDNMITIMSALTLIGKLHQINCGHVRDDDGNIYRIESNRIKVLLEELENVPGKSVIWARYREDIRLIAEALTAKYGRDCLVTYFGDTDASDRPISVAKFRDDPKCRWFVGTPTTGGKGLNGLQQVCSNAIYYSNDYKLEPRLQSEDRIHRIGQHYPCTYTDLVCRSTVDVEIVKALREKKDLATEVLDTIRLMLTSDLTSPLLD